MGNIIQEAVSKIAGNVTQSIASGVIVTLITTYVLVDIGKKDSPQPGPKVDSVKIIPAPTTVQQSYRMKTEPGRPSGENKPLPNGGEQRLNETDLRARVALADPSERDPKIAVDNRRMDQKLESPIIAAKAKNDTLAKEKETPKNIKQVQKRADDVFEELDEEVAKKPPH